MGERVLVIGSGGREHALCEKFKTDINVKEVFCAPGNGGTAYSSGITNIPYEEDRIYDEIRRRNIDLVVIGPENYLAEGLSDRLREKGVRVFGFSQKAAMLESSKVFAKEFMRTCGVKTPDFRVFDNYGRARDYIKKIPPEDWKGVFIKADELCGGKGALPASNKEEALEALKALFVEKKCGSGQKVVIESKLSGEEVTVMSFTDGRDFALMPAAQDYKPIYDNNKGPNTGGMGAYAPAPIFDTFKERFVETVLEPTKQGISARMLESPGVLYFGLMGSDSGEPYVLEYNARFGDPETQAVLPLLESDLTPILEGCIDKNLGDVPIKWANKCAVCVILATAGYPVNYKGEVFPIKGVEEAEKMPGVKIYHAGTEYSDGVLYTKGGRALGVTGIGNSIGEARRNAYSAIKKIHFEGMYYRKDIAL